MKASPGSLRKDAVVQAWGPAEAPLDPRPSTLDPQTARQLNVQALRKCRHVLWDRTARTSSGASRQLLRAFMRVCAGSTVQPKGVAPLVTGFRCHDHRHGGAARQPRTRMAAMMERARASPRAGRSIRCARDGVFRQDSAKCDSLQEARASS